MILNTKMTNSHASARNACKLCAPLGASLAFSGVEGAITVLHGSQGCSTYIRRYLISHFKEPIDIASSSFSEATTIFGGKENLRTALKNVIRQYHPKIIGVATTCLAETIGEDLHTMLKDFRIEEPEFDWPILVPVSTPSYRDTHAEGFRRTTREIIEAIAAPTIRHQGINVFPSVASPADLQHLKEICADFGLQTLLLPDYSETLDGPTRSEYFPIAPGGAKIPSAKVCAGARASIDFGDDSTVEETAGTFLEKKYGVTRKALEWPIGIRRTDAFLRVLERLADRDMPEKYYEERGRLVDAYIDAHKYAFGRRAVVYGDPDLVVGLTSFLREIGVMPVLCATGAEPKNLAKRIAATAMSAVPHKQAEALDESLDAYSTDLPEPTVLEGVDFMDIEEHATALKPHILIGSSKGYGMSKRLKAPLVRVGFPVHDRIGGGRILHVGYRGAQQLFDVVINALIEAEQDANPVGYSYM